MNPPSPSSSSPLSLSPGRSICFESIQKELQAAVRHHGEAVLGGEHHDLGVVRSRHRRLRFEVPDGRQELHRRLDGLAARRRTLAVVVSTSGGGGGGDALRDGFDGASEAFRLDPLTARFRLGREDRRPVRSLGVPDRRGRPSLGLVHHRQLLALALEDRRSLSALGGHLQLHRLLDGRRRSQVLKLDAGDLDPPTEADLVEIPQKLAVDPLPRRERLVQGQLPDLLPQVRQAQVEDGAVDVLDGVPGRDRVSDLRVHDRVRLDRGVVLRVALLRRNVQHALPDGHVEAHRFRDRNQEVPSGFELAVELAEPLHKKLVSRRDDPKARNRAQSAAHDRNDPPGSIRTEQHPRQKRRRRRRRRGNDDDASQRQQRRERQQPDPEDEKNRDQLSRNTRSRAMRHHRSVLLVVVVVFVSANKQKIALRRRRRR
mmetsp:Transcript_23906/g.56486  ORF Transcript_23906/g.56486 Transcript_23906/m.56486 type:complete len:429 (+) Transcript_23906:383-1669(+)